MPLRCELDGTGGVTVGGEEESPAPVHPHDSGELSDGSNSDVCGEVFDLCDVLGARDVNPTVALEAGYLHACAPSKRIQCAASSSASLGVIVRKISMGAMDEWIEALTCGPEPSAGPGRSQRERFILDHTGPPQHQ